MMRGGSMFAKYCRKGIPSGSRQCSFTSNNSEVRRVKTVEEADEYLRGLFKRMLSYGIETLAFKSLFAYVGYKAALGRSPYDRQRFLSEMEDLCDKYQFFDKKAELLKAQRMKNNN